MSTQSLFTTRWNDASENEEASYRRLSAPALVAFFFGVLSFVIYFSVWFFFIAVIGIVLALVAVWSICRSEGALFGKGLAHCGLALSLISLVSVSVMWPYYVYELRLEGNRFFQIWFDALQEGNIPLAKGMSSPYWERPSIDNEENWWQSQYADKWKHRSIHNYTDNKLVRILLALGKKEGTTITYYKTLASSVGDGKDTVVSIYAVTYLLESGEKETFFVKMTGVRQFPTKDIKNAGWSLDPSPALYVPAEYEYPIRIQSSKNAVREVLTLVGNFSENCISFGETDLPHVRSTGRDFRRKSPYPRRKGRKFRLHRFGEISPFGRNDISYFSIFP